MVRATGTGVVRDLDDSVMIVCEGVQKFFGSFEALKRVNLQVARGEVFLHRRTIRWRQVDVSAHPQRTGDVRSWSDSD